MENATKALIIAAAVLIAIILIALGIKIVNTSDVSSKADSTSTAINTAADKRVQELQTELGVTEEE